MRSDVGCSLMATFYREKGRSPFPPFSPGPANKLYIPNGSGGTCPHSLQRHGGLSAPHATSCPTRHLPPSQPLRWVSTWQRASQPAAPATTLAHTCSAASSPQATSCGSWGPCSCVPAFLSQANAGLLLNGRALPRPLTGSMSPPGMTGLLEGSTKRGYLEIQFQTL